jgi:hypothetical protein
MRTKALPESTDVMELDQFVARAAARDRYNIEKHLLALDNDPLKGRADLWRRLLTKLSLLVPLPFQSAGPNVVLFFRPDGKYRMQVFALEDAGNGLVYIYLTDVLQAAVDAKILRVEGDRHTIVAPPGGDLPVHAIDTQNTPDPAAYVKHMIGWNRKAVRIALDGAEATGIRVDTAEALCSLAASQWATPAVK